MAEDKEREELLQRAMRACSGREYCISDISAMLMRWGATDEETRGWIIDRLIKEKFIDENRYSRAFVIDHFRQDHWGRVKISMALKQKRVDPAAIASGLESIGEDEYLEKLRKILGDQQRKIKAKNRLDLKGKLLRYALGKGFESNLVYDAISAIVSE
jgi:regulatory protein